MSATNEASNATGVNGDETDNSLTSAGAVYTFEIASSEVDLSVTVDESTQNATKGEFLTYVFTLTNGSNDDAIGVKARIIIPSNTEFVAAIPSQGVYDANTKYWDLGTVSTGTQTLSITVKMK